MFSLFGFFVSCLSLKVSRNGFTVVPFVVLLRALEAEIGTTKRLNISEHGLHLAHARDKTAKTFSPLPTISG